MLLSIWIVALFDTIGLRSLVALFHLYHCALLTKNASSPVTHTSNGGGSTVVALGVTAAFVFSVFTSAKLTRVLENNRIVAGKIMLPLIEFFPLLNIDVGLNNVEGCGGRLFKDETPRNISIEISLCD